MTGRDGKADPRPIISAHLKTLTNHRTARRRGLDFAAMFGLPLSVMAACLVGGLHLAAGTSVGLLTVTGVLGAFLFALCVELFDRAASWADSPPEQGAATSEHAFVVEELAASSAYAALVSIAASVVLVVASVVTAWPLRVAGSVGIGLSVHLLLTLMMVLRRVFLMTQDRLLRVRTNVTRRPSADRP